MKIPKSVILFARTIKIKQVTKVDADDNSGEYLHEKGEIRIKRGLPQVYKEQTYLHELTHALLMTLSYDTINQDEQFVDSFAQLLHQALESSDVQP